MSTSTTMIGLSAPESASRTRVSISTWDIAGEHVSYLGLAEFTPTEARAFAAKLITAADESDAKRY